MIFLKEGLRDKDASRKLAIRWANAKKGMIWPCAMNGSITILSFLCDISFERSERDEAEERKKWRGQLEGPKLQQPFPTRLKDHLY
ncbi:hypothetical protein NC651_009618 [Populus alba x Populus x berolinensis]|nr:hypothetical protein NC651_009618 [Populus alba x Populus x berolinensis]